MEDHALYVLHIRELQKQHQQVEAENMWRLLGENKSLDRQLVPYSRQSVVIAYGAFLSATGCLIHILVLITLAKLLTGVTSGLNRYLLIVFSSVQFIALAGVVPLEIAREYLGVWGLGRAVCEVWVVAEHSLVPLLLWTLVCLVIDKLKDIRAVSRNKFTKGTRKTLVLMITLLLLSFLSVSPLFIWKILSGDVILVEVCAIVIDGNVTMTLTILCFFIPASLLIILLFLLAVETQAFMRKYRNELEIQEFSHSRVSNSEIVMETGLRTNKKPGKSRAAYARIGRSLHDLEELVSDTVNACLFVCILSASCVLLWAPFYIATIWLSYGRCEEAHCFDPRIWALLQWLGYTSLLVCPGCFLVDKRVRATLKYWLHIEGEDEEDGSGAVDFVYARGSQGKVSRQAGPIRVEITGPNFISSL